MGRRQRLVTVVVRGVIFKVSPEQARELEAAERKIRSEEWNTNYYHHKPS